MPDKAREVLLALRQRNPALRVTVAGRETPIFANDAEALDWLVKLIGTPPPTAAGRTDRWLMFRGDAARNASMPGSAPLLNMRWRVLSTDDPQEEKSLEQRLEDVARNPVRPTIPAFHPLAVGDVLLMRTLENLLGGGHRHRQAALGSAGGRAGRPGRGQRSPRSRSNSSCASR